MVNKKKQQEKKQQKKKRHRKMTDMSPVLQHKLRQSGNNSRHKQVTTNFGKPKEEYEESGKIDLVEPYDDGLVLKTIGRHREVTHSFVCRAKAIGLSPMEFPGTIIQGICSSPSDSFF